LPKVDPLPGFDLYEVLGLSPAATRAECDAAWRSAVRAAHPDRARGVAVGEATDRTARLNIAREWLTNPVKRARYDALRLPSSGVNVPPIDPVGAWPTAPERQRRAWSAPLSQVPVAVALAVATVTLVLGIGSNVVTIVAFDLSLVALLYYGLYALVGVVYRRLRS
jgi:hypothetical protein